MAKPPTEPRVTVDLPVRIWGMSAEGRPFSQQARAQNISSEGALLTGVESELKVGDVIGVQCDEQEGALHRDLGDEHRARSRRIRSE